MRSSTYQAPADVVDAVVAAAVCRSVVLVIGGQPGAVYRLLDEIHSTIPVFGLRSPIRVPHHTISVRALRAEIEIARGGILVLDDVTEFSDECIDMLFAEHGATGDFAVVARAPRPVETDTRTRRRISYVSTWSECIVGMSAALINDQRSRGVISDVVIAGIDLFQAGRDAGHNFSEAYPPPIYMRTLLRATRTDQ